MISGFRARQLLGDLLAFSGALFAAFYLLIGRTWSAKLGMINYTFPLYATSAVTLTLTFILSARISRSPDRQIDYLWFVLLAVVPTLLGHSLYNYSLKHFKAHLVGIVILGEPIMASIWALMLFGESPTVMTVLGAAADLRGNHLFFRPRAESFALTKPLPAYILTSSVRQSGRCCLIGFRKYGAVAQLGERYVRNVQVGGSIPLCSILIFVIPNVTMTKKGQSQ